MRIQAFAASSSESEVVSYRLTEDAGGLFEINTTSGIVTVADALDFESTNEHRIEVQASVGNAMSSKIFTINVADNLLPSMSLAFPRVGSQFGGNTIDLQRTFADVEGDLVKITVQAGAELVLATVD